MARFWYILYTSVYTIKTVSGIKSINFVVATLFHYSSLSFQWYISMNELLYVKICKAPSWPKLCVLKKAFKCVKLRYSRVTRKHTDILVVSRVIMMDMLKLKEKIMREKNQISSRWNLTSYTKASWHVLCVSNQASCKNW